MIWELDWLEARAKMTPDRTAIVDAETGQTWLYKEVNGRARAIAVWLRGKGIQKGDRVALLSPNSIHYFDLLFACGKIGAVFVPLNWRLSIEELTYILKDCQPAILFFHSDFLKEMKRIWTEGKQSLQTNGNHYEKLLEDSRQDQSLQFSKVFEEDPLAIIYTGGTTGKPKGAVLPHRSMIWNSISTIASWNLTSEDRTVTYLPLFHTGGINALSVPLLMAGGTVAIAREFSPEKVIADLEKFHSTIVLLVPTMYHMLVKSALFNIAEFKEMKVFLSGGAPCPLEIYDAFRQKGLAFKEGYGLTEAGPNNFYIDPAEAVRKKGSVGRPMLFNTVKIMDDHGREVETGQVGELVIRGNHVFSSYWNNVAATTETIKEDWLYTGDLAKKDEMGYYYIVGRKKDMIITGGENVYPLEIEHWLCEHPRIQEAAVIGMPDEKWGEAVTAFLVLENGCSITENEIKEHCRRKLGGYKVPKKFHFISQMPKTHVGKIDKKQLALSISHSQNNHLNK